MNKLDDVQYVLVTSSTGPKPYRGFVVGQSVIAKEGTDLAKLLNNYYPESHGELIINEALSDIDYNASPLGYGDDVKAQYWDVKARSIYGSRIFSIASAIAPGVTVRSVLEHKLGRVVEQAIQTILEDGTTLNQDELVEICVSDDENVDDVGGFFVEEWQCKK